MTNNTPQVVITRLEDRSLEAYKAWITGILVAIKGEEAASDSKMTEEKWQAAHERHWAKRDAARAKREREERGNGRE